MAFLRTANAIVVHPRTTQSGWSKVRTAARIAGQPSHSLVEQASEILGRTFDPKDYLLSHCTLVASVDVETVHGVKLGSVREGSRTINRKYADYRITAATDQFINNNLDAFAREVLLKSYRTLIGGQNYCFVPGTPVLMADGTYKPIEEIRVGDEVLSHTGSARKVVHTFDREVDESICAIRLNHHKDRILTTGNHPFAAIDVTTGSVSPRKGSKPRSTIRYYHDQVTRGLRGDSHHLSQFEAKFGWRNANQITTGTHLLGPSHQCGANTGDIDRAILLGYYLAEGCQYTPASSPAESKGVVISPGIHERAVVDDILVRCARAFPDTKVSVKASHSSTWRVELRGMEIGAWMLEHGGQYSESKRMSREVLSWSTEALSYVLASWLNGDGNFHGQTSRLRGITASPALGQQMAYIAEICGVRAALTFCEVKNKGQVSGQVKMVVGGRDVSYDVIPKHDTWLLTVSKDSIPLLASKTIRWKGFVPRVSKRSDLFQWGDRRVRTVASNESIPYAGHVYNIEVEVDNSYVIAPGIAVHNCEHVQVEDLSKGRIIDAVARDIGDSIYVDILVATDRKHTQLVKDIEEDRLTTLSMGCSVEHTTCTKCGNVAVDETELCDCVKYSKGNVFLDERGHRHRIAELCGHPSEDPTGGVTFIEASWVANPAFTGAVMRNIITPESLSPKMAQQMQSVLSSPPPQWVVSGNQKAASSDMNGTPSVVGKVSERRTAFDFGEGGAEGEEAKTPEAKPSPFDELEDRILQTVMDRIETKVRDEISKKDAPAATPEQSTAAPNDNLQASKVARTVYAAAASAMVKTASSHADLLNKIAILDSSYGLNVPVDIYRAVLAVGPMNRHASTESFLTACRGTLGRTLGYSEGRALLRLGRILNQAEGNTNRKVTPR